MHGSLVQVIVEPSSRESYYLHDTLVEVSDLQVSV